MFFGAKVTKAPLSRISPEPCASIGQASMRHSETKSSSSARFLIDMQADHLLILAKHWRRQRPGMLPNKFYMARPGWRVTRGFQQDASWSRVRWLAEIRLGLFRRKQRHAALPARLRCVVAFSEQSGKGIYRETPPQANWPIT